MTTWTTHLCLALVLATATACAGAGERERAAPATDPTPSPAVVPVEASAVAAAPSVAVQQRALGRVKLTGGPDFLAASGGLLWVKHERPLLRGLDPSTGQVRREVQLAENPEGLNGNCNGIGGDAQHLWTCAGGGLGLVTSDATAVEPVAGVRKISDQTFFPVLGGRVWVIEPDGLTVTGLRVADGSDPLRLPVGVRCVDAAAGKGSYLWLACPTAGVGARLDVESGEVVQVPGLRDAKEVAVGEDAFFAYRAGLARVDQDSAEVTGAVAVTGAVHLHATPDVVWARGAGGAFLGRVDARSLALLEQITAPEQGGGSVLLAYDALWVSAYDENALYRLKPG